MGYQKPIASPNRKGGQGQRLQGKGWTLTMLEAFSLAGVGVSVAAMKALSWGLRMAKEAARTQGVFLLFLYRNHTHKTSHFLTKKK